MKKAIWITWEDQRRTQELASHLGVELFKFSFKGGYLGKVLKSSFLTIKTILYQRPSILIVQNPSMALAALACFFRFLGYKLVVDRHSNFKFHTAASRALKYRIFHFLSRYTVKCADLTIVTNSYLAEVVTKWGGKPFVLQDKIPDLALGNHIALKGKHNFVFPCSFDHDEPIEEVLNACSILPNDWIIYITGNHKKANKDIVNKGIPNVVFTGFLSDKEYQTLVRSADVVIALTTQDHTLLCTAYEALASAKPMVLSNTESLREYFSKGVVLTGNTSVELAKSFSEAISNYQTLKKQAADLAIELSRDWQKRFDGLKQLIFN